MGRREHLEREQKVMMAMAMESGLSPMFTSGSGYLQAEVAKAETAHLQQILRQLRQLKHAEKGEQEKGDVAKKDSRRTERLQRDETERNRMSLVGQTVSDVSLGLTGEDAVEARSDEALPTEGVSFDEDQSQPPDDEQDHLSALLEQAPVEVQVGRAADAPLSDIEDVPAHLRTPPRELAPEKPEEAIVIG